MPRFPQRHVIHAAMAVLAVASLAPTRAEASRQLSFERPYCQAAPMAPGACRIAVPEGDFASVEPVDPDGFGIALYYPDIERLIAPWVFAGRGKPAWADRVRAVKLTTEGDTLTQWVTAPRRADPSQPSVYLVQVTYEVMGTRVTGPGLEVELQTKGGNGLGVLSHFPDSQAGASGRSATYVARVEQPEGGQVSRVGIRIRHAAGAAAVVVSDVKLIMVNE